MNHHMRRAIEDGEIPADTRRWYDRFSRSWVVQLVDANGYEIGAAEYIGAGGGGRAIASKIEREIREECGL